MSKNKIKSYIISMLGLKPGNFQKTPQKISKNTLFIRFIKEKMASLSRNRLFFLVFLLILSRTFVISTINSVPDTEPIYVNLAQQLFESSNKIDTCLSPGYPVLLYVMNLMFNNWKLSSQIIYIVFSIGIALISYVIAKTLFSKETALYSLLIFIFLPNLTSAVAGYSHIVVVSMFFLYLAVYFFLLILKNQKIIDFIAFSSFMLFATLIRSENVVYLIMFLLIYVGIVIYQILKRSRVFPISFLIITFTIFLGGLWLQYYFIKSRSSTNYWTLLGNARYSYKTYLHTLSLRSEGTIMDSSQISSWGIKAFGTPEDNQFSIIKAIMKNPAEAIKNIAFNIKSLLKDLGHPLFIPVFLYPFLGIGIFSTSLRSKWKDHLFLISLLIPTLLTISLFHEEIRYMSPLVPPFVIWIALGISKLRSAIKKPVVIALVFFLATLFIVYTFHMRISQHTKNTVLVNS